MRVEPLGGPGAGVVNIDADYAVCDITSDLETWFEQKTVNTHHGVTLAIPVNNLCWPCGTACQVWSLEQKQTIIANNRERGAFWITFGRVREGVKVAMKVSVLERFSQHVFSNGTLRMKVIRRFA